MHDVIKDFGAAVREARHKHGLTQLTLAEQLGKTDRSLSDLENGKTDPKLSTITQLALALGISVDTVIGMTPEDDVAFCVKQFFQGMPPEEAERYIQLCEGMKNLIK